MSKAVGWKEKRARFASAYMARRDGMSWPEIAETHGFPSRAHATSAVREMALRRGLRWPIVQAAEPMYEDV